MRLTWILIHIVIFGSTHIGNAQTTIASQYQQTKELNTEEAYNQFFTTALDSIVHYHSSEDVSSSRRILNFILRIPYDDALAEKFDQFINQQRKAIASTLPIEAGFLPNYLASWHASNGYYEKAHTNYLESSQTLYALQDTQYLHMVYYWLGQNYQLGKADGAQAMICADQAERVYKSKNVKDPKFEGNLYYLRGIAYRSSDWNKSIDCFRKAQEIKGDRYGELENFITKSLIDLGRYDEAYASAQKASEIYSTTYGEDYGVWQTYEAITLDRIGKSEQALRKINESIKNCAYMEPTDPSFIKIFYYKAQILKNMGKFDEALDNCQTVFSSYYPNYTTKSNIGLPDLSEQTINHWVLDALKEQGDILIHKYYKTKNNEHLSLALETYNKGIKDIEIRRKQMENWDSKEQYNNYLFGIYEQALIASALLFQSEPTEEYKKQVLFFLGKSKGTLLQENQRSNFAKEDIPQEVLNSEKKLHQSIVQLETQIMVAESKGDSKKSKELKNELFDLRQTLNDFKKNHNTYYAELNPTKNDDNYKEVMSKLSDNTAVVAYHLSKDQIVKIAFDNEELHVDLIPRNATFNETVLKLGELLSDWRAILSNRKESEDSIQICIQHLSDNLFRQVSKFKKRPTQLIVMPDDILHTIPFELLSNAEKYNSTSNDFDLSYAYSFSSLLSTTQNDNQSVSFAGFAPAYGKSPNDLDQDEHQDDDSNWIALRAGLIDIPEARKNVSQLANRYGGDAWLQNKATKANFNTVAGNYDILHLGMHSQLNDFTSSLSNLVFSGESENELFLNEIQSMDIPASLVVLSACNTGVGRNVKGEGPFSLARAFFYAGTKSTLMSLWQVPDEQTSRIMNLFYTHLESGLNKSQALSKAKRDYLTTASTLESHPSFWAGFVLVGDVAPLSLQTKNDFFNATFVYGLVALLLAIVIWWFFNKRRKQ